MSTSRHNRSSDRRSRSPTDDSHSSRHRRDRDREPDRHRHRRSPSPKSTAPVLLPSNAKPLDIDASLLSHFALFAKYLDVQKSVNVMDLDDREMRSRFKRFVGRWNMGELASSWYDKDYRSQIDSDPSLPKWEGYLKRRAETKPSDKIIRPRDPGGRDRDRDRERDRERDRDRNRDRSKRDREQHREKDGARSDRRDRDSRDHKKRQDRDPESYEQTESRIRGMTDEELTNALQKLEGANTPSGASEDVEMKDGNESDDSDMIGPSLPDSIPKPHAGAKPPTTQDLELQRELNEEEEELHRADLRYERKKERKIEKERLEELAPRAEPGSRERQLEKKRENAATNKAFADAKSGDVEEVAETALMGGDEGFHQHKAALERKKNERELRKEALLRARKAEREERLQVHRAKEEQTMKMLRALAEKFR
ncbi:hypothetical protein ABW20_dc0107436 [Dactylellina cionopaga]|nr:hypothetical protein ABW20_dc0107436 [Dactylellina cionopaga]